MKFYPKPKILLQTVWDTQIFNMIWNYAILSKKKGVISIMESRWRKPFKDREEAKAEVSRCELFADVCQCLSILFAVLGVTGDALNITLGLEPTSWLLLAILAGLNAIIGHMNKAITKHLLGIESESKKEK